MLLLIWSILVTPAYPQVATLWKGSSTCEANVQYNMCDCNCLYQPNIQFYPGPTCNENTCSSKLCGAVGQETCTTPHGAKCETMKSREETYNLQADKQCHQIKGHQETIFYFLTCGESLDDYGDDSNEDGPTYISRNEYITWSAKITRNDCQEPYLRVKGNEDTCVTYVPRGYVYPFSFKIDCYGKQNEQIWKSVAAAIGMTCFFLCTGMWLYKYCKNKQPLSRLSLNGPLFGKRVHVQGRAKPGHVTKAQRNHVGSAAHEQGRPTAQDDTYKTLPG